METKKIIANPLYDTAFKWLMENMEIALFIIKTIIGEQVVDIEVAPQERIIKKLRKKKVGEGQNTVSVEVFSMIRYDFIAKIRTEQDKYKNVLIEIQKSSNPGNLKRFRSYIGELYKKVDLLDSKKGKVEKSLPVIGIFMLGFTLPDIKAAVIKVNRQYVDVIANQKIEKKIDFIEGLTHDGYFIQIPCVGNSKPGTDLEKLLSLFEQRSFVERNTKKIYDYPIDNNIIKKMVEVLSYVAADPEQQKLLEAEWLAKSEEEEIENMEKELAENKKELAESKKTIAKKDETIAKKEKENADLRRQLAKLQESQKL
jgi:hypothetical protein